MTIFGWDASHFDNPDTHSAVTQGFSFFTHKAGGDANDPELATWWNYMKPYRGKALLGAYWVLYPGSAAARADAFLARLDAQCPGWRDGPFILQVDCEEWNQNPATAPSRADIKAFCDRLAAKCPKLRPIVYAPEWVYGDKLAGLGYPLWASRYVTGTGTAAALYPGDASSRWEKYSGQVPAILQFTSSAKIAGQTTCDANAFRGSLADLVALVAPGWEADVATLDQDDINKLATATANAIAAMTAFTDGGGQHSKGGDAVLNSSYPKAPGALRTYVWANLQDLQTGITSINAAVTALAAKAGADVDESAIIAGVLAGLTPAALAAGFAAAGITAETLAAAVPDDIAEEVVTLIGQRFQGA